MEGGGTIRSPPPPPPPFIVAGGGGGGGDSPLCPPPPVPTPMTTHAYGVSLLKGEPSISSGGSRRGGGGGKKKMYTIILALPIPTTIESYSVWQCAKQRDTRRNYSLPIICNGSWVYDLRVLAEEYEKVGLRPTNAMVARFEGIERDSVKTTKNHAGPSSIS